MDAASQLAGLMIPPTAVGLVLALWLRAGDRTPDSWHKLLLSAALGLLGAGLTVALDWSGHRSNLNDIAVFGLPLVFFLGFLFDTRPRPSTALQGYGIIAGVHFLIRYAWSKGPGDQGMGALGAIVFYFGALVCSVFVLLGAFLVRVVEKE